MYKTPDMSIWYGRDDEANAYYHQVINELNLDDPIVNKHTNNVVLIGFESDIGVRRNMGRSGAKDAPYTIRKAFSGMPVHFNIELNTIYDAGNVVCNDQKLELAFDELINRIDHVLRMGAHPVLLGGGHEISYPHFTGLMKFVGPEKLGCINIDPHFDIRKYPKGSHSGSSFRQILDEIGNNKFHYLPIGINPSANIRELFITMDKAGQDYIELNEVKNHFDEIKSKILDFINLVDHVYLTIDMDVFYAPFAPGVSAPASMGLSPEEVTKLISHIYSSGKVLSVDIAETNPKFDIDARTSRLAAQVLYQVVDEILNNNDHT